MKPEQLPPDDAKVIVFLDANMPNVKPCKRDGDCPPDRMCTHRFGPNVWVCERPPTYQRHRDGEVRTIPFTRMSDLEVVQWCLSWMVVHHRGLMGMEESRRFVLMTHDKEFLESVQEQSESRRARENPGFAPLTFVPWERIVHGKHCRISAYDALGPIQLNVFCIDGGYRNRNNDLRLVLCCASGLLCTCHARTAH